MTSKTSCCSVENGSFALGIISSVSSCITILASILSIVVAGYEQAYSDGGLRSAYGMVLLIILVGFLLISIVSLIFSVLLCHGVVQRKASFVLMYFVYGIIIMVFSIITILIGCAFLEYDDGVKQISWGVVGVYIIIHSLLLCMVYKTYRKFRTADSKQKEVAIF